jgi:hypothetical protein
MNVAKKAYRKYPLGYRVVQDDRRVEPLRFVAELEPSEGSIIATLPRIAFWLAAAAAVGVVAWILR